ncbi:hypothetical protein F5887DRAFT_1282356 [Amanita rubescens]|nr:hypothetical protein F5887DRAFT_1282356 [Amanita rubescens]
MARSKRSSQKDWDSDALDEVSIEKSPKKTRATKRKKVKESDEEEEVELDDGQEVVGVVVKAPKTGQVPPGQISKNTLDFLTKLKDPEYNDRQWFKLQEPVYRQAEKEWKDFIDEFTELLLEVDPQIPHLPAKDVVHRIYRDVRFSNDKTPYKQNFSASFSRSGRKGLFAGYHLSGIGIVILVQKYTENAHSQTGKRQHHRGWAMVSRKNELATIRSHIKEDSQPLRDIISSPEFETYFGKAEAHPEGKRQNIFGLEDELKVAPKGVDKEHKDIDLLKCRSLLLCIGSVTVRVLDSEFGSRVAEVVQVMRPFVTV